MAHKDALLAEYKVCSEIYNASSNRAWQSTSLIAGFALTGAILVLTRAQEKPILSTKIVITLIGIGVIASLYMNLRFLHREKWRQSIAIWRMKQLEEAMGLYLVVTIGKLDDYMRKHKKQALNDLPSKTKALLTDYQKPSGWPFINWLSKISIAIWALIIVAEWFHLFWPHL